MINKCDFLAAPLALLLVMSLLLRPVSAKPDGVPKRTSGGATRAVPEVVYHGALLLVGAIWLD